MLPCICYSSWNCNNAKHIKVLKEMGFKGWRIFVPLGMLPPQIPINSTSATWRNYIINFVNYCPDGCWDWDENSTNWWGSVPNQKFKDCLDFCKENDWLPILNLCASDETHGWIDLAPTSDKWDWLNKFCYEFACYLRDVYKFDRVDLEPINEPNEKGAVNDWYAPLVIAMSKGWKRACPDWKVHACGVDINQQNYINACLDHEIKDINGKVIDRMINHFDYVSVHCLTIKEWESQLIELTYENVKDKGKKLTLLEMSPCSQSNDRPPLGYIPERMKKLVGRCDMYGIVLMIRNEAIGTSMDLDDIYMYPLKNPDGLYCTSLAKRNCILEFNKTHFTDYERSDMQLADQYQRGSKGVVVKFIQACLNNEIYTSPRLIEDGIYGLKTEEAVKRFQAHNLLTQTGIVKDNEIKILAKNHNDKWIDLDVAYSCGER